jgi:hypothetical protein
VTDNGGGSGMWARSIPSEDGLRHYFDAEHRALCGVYARVLTHGLASDGPLSLDVRCQECVKALGDD